MKIEGTVHCFFEQSGTFKNEFIKLGIPAADYDIQDDYGETDHVVNLFAEIECAYDGRPSLFDGIESSDLIMAFFPCVFFCQASMMQFSWNDINYRGLDDKGKSDKILQRLENRTYFYSVAIKMLTVAKQRGLRLIMENPWGNTYLKNFVIPPALIDYNRMLRGDYFKKPTAYWYVNCVPTVGFSIQKDKKQREILNCRHGKFAGECSAERSMISPDYARNFICDYIIGREQVHTMKLLFD